MTAKLLRVRDVTGGRAVYANTRFASACGVAVLADGTEYRFHAQHERGRLPVSVTLRSMKGRVIRRGALEELRAGIEKDLAVLNTLDAWHRRPLDPQRAA